MLLEMQIDVKGPGMSPVYEFLKSKQPGEIEWNYVKVRADGICSELQRYGYGVLL